MKIYERPKCHNKECNEYAITNYAGLWLCGRCFAKILNRLENKKKEEALYIIENGI